MSLQSSKWCSVIAIMIRLVGVAQSALLPMTLLQPMEQAGFKAQMTALSLQFHHTPTRTARGSCMVAFQAIRIRCGTTGITYPLLHQ
jgi:hypothetical protein